MSRLDDAIADVVYIYYCLKAYRDIVESGSCNSCKKNNDCEWKPAWGEMVRYNCPHYVKEGEDD